MRVFVTGAGGFIGQAVVEELLNNGHQVLGLARSDASMDAIKKAGAEPHRGDIEDLDSIKSGAEAADGVIHLAFIHDFSNFARVLQVDRTAIQAMAEALTGTGKPLVIASGTGCLPMGQLADEDTEPARGTMFGERGKSEDLLKSLSKETNVRGISIRLSPTVHGAGEKGFVYQLGELAQKNGFVTNVADGSSRWPAVHRDDAAALFRLALEKGRSGSVYHGAAETVHTREIMEALGAKLKLPVEGRSAEEAGKTIGMFAVIVGMDNYVSSEKTRKELGWHPTQLDLVTDIKENYFP